MCKLYYGKKCLWVYRLHASENVNTGHNWLPGPTLERPDLSSIVIVGGKWTLIGMEKNAFFIWQCVLFHKRHSTVVFCLSTVVHCILSNGYIYNIVIIPDKTLTNTAVLFANLLLFGDTVSAVYEKSHGETPTND